MFLLQFSVHLLLTLSSLQYNPAYYPRYRYSLLHYQIISTCISSHRLLHLDNPSYGGNQKSDMVHIRLHLPVHIQFYPALLEKALHESENLLHPYQLLRPRGFYLKLLLLKVNQETPSPDPVHFHIAHHFQ